MMELPAMIDIDGCKTIKELAHRVLNEYEYNGKTIREWADLLTNPQTNADRIRAMSYEELADFLNELAHCGCPENKELRRKMRRLLEGLAERGRERMNDQTAKADEGKDQLGYMGRKHD